jgi:hypothetical protein
MSNSIFTGVLHRQVGGLFAPQDAPRNAIGSLSI